MVRKITDSKWFYILVSVLLAFALWIYVGKEANPITTGTVRSVQVVFSGLDVSPTSDAVPTFCSKGSANPTTAITAAGPAANCGNGFAITLAQGGAGGTGLGLNEGQVTAYRANNNQYTYSLSRYYQSNKVTCTPGTSTEDAAICAEYCGLDSTTGACCNDGNPGACAAPSNTAPSNP